jgi:hypothetical protein
MGKLLILVESHQWRGESLCLDSSASVKEMKNDVTIIMKVFIYNSAGVENRLFSGGGVGRFMPLDTNERQVVVARLLRLSPEGEVKWRSHSE